MAKVVVSDGKGKGPGAKLGGSIRLHTDLSLVRLLPHVIIKVPKFQDIPPASKAVAPTKSFFS